MNGIAIPGYEGLYTITRDGRVFNVRRQRFLALTPRQGYLFASLRKDGKQTSVGVHRLVALAYIPAVAGKEQVNHKNCVRNDNRVENLEWMTMAENVAHGQLN